MVEHGTASCYVTGCRRTECREAMLVSNRRSRAKRYADRELIDGRLVAFGEKVTHGTRTAHGYYGCRCEQCAAAHADRARLRYRRKIAGGQP